MKKLYDMEKFWMKQRERVLRYHRVSSLPFLVRIASDKGFDSTQYSSAGRIFRGISVKYRADALANWITSRI
jgi:hypothetical protein